MKFETIKMNKETIVWFGKHRGLPVGELVENYPEYAIWADGEIPEFNLSDSLLNRAYELQAENEKL